MLIRKRDSVHGNIYYLDTRSGVAYKSTVSALSWPHGDRSGCFIVLGQHLNTPTAVNARTPLTVLHEYIDYSTDALLQHVDICRERFAIFKTITPVNDERFIQVEEYNDRLFQQRKYPLQVDNPATWTGKGEGKIPYYISLVQKRVGIGSKSLTFGEYNAAKDQVKSIRSEDINRSPLTYPAMCALCWCLEHYELERELLSARMKNNIGFQSADDLGGY